jgi:predicted deacetylase
MILSPAQYLLRIDDLCPTVCAQRWQQFQSLIEEFRLHPIVAIVPDNQDSELQVSPPDPAFWDCMRALEVAGAAIGLHGYHHRCVSRGRSLVDLHRISEFAGVSARACASCAATASIQTSGSLRATALTNTPSRHFWGREYRSYPTVLRAHRFFVAA